MAEVVKLCAFAVAACILTLAVRTYKSELARQAAIAAGIMVLIYAINMLGGVFDDVKALLDAYGVPNGLLSTLVKITGTVYLLQFASDTCRDAGENAIAGRVELSGRVMIVLMCMPSIKQAMEMIARLVEGTI